MGPAGNNWPWAKAHARQVARCRRTARALRLRMATRHRAGLSPHMPRIRARLLPRHASAGSALLQSRAIQLQSMAFKAECA